MKCGYTHVHGAYTKFLAVEAALQKYESMKRDGTWPLPVAAKHREIIEIFNSKTTHGNNKAAFAQVSLYPAMEDWLLSQADALPDTEVWGSKEHTVANCRLLVEDYIRQNKGKKAERRRDLDVGEGSSKSKGKKVEQVEQVTEKPKKSRKHGK